MPITAFSNKAFDFLHRAFLGESPQQSYPPTWLWTLWVVVALLRMPSIHYSLDEDSIWCLITKIDQPWIVTLGFKDAFTLNHIVNSVLARILIKGAGSHFVEITYRIPCLLAGMLAMPLGFAVFSRIGGRVCGIFSGATIALLPVYSLWATTPRGYMLLVLFTIWALGLTPGVSQRLHPIRLGVAYFLLASSHGLGIINVACLAAMGCFTGSRPVKGPHVLANGLLAIPALAFNIPMLLSMREVRNQLVQPQDTGLLRSAMFLPDWVAYQFGSGLDRLPGIGWIFSGLMIYGVVVTFKRSKPTGTVLALLMAAIPASFVLAKTSWSQEWYSMGCNVFWIWAIGMASADLYSRVQMKFPGRGKYLILANGLFFLALMPRMYDYLRHPRQDYAGIYRTLKLRSPHQEKVFCFSPIGLTGLEYYARQNGLGVSFLTGREPIGDSLWRVALGTPAVMVMENSMPPEIISRIRERSSSVQRFNGIASPLSLYFLNGTPPPLSR